MPNVVQLQASGTGYTIKDARLIDVFEENINPLQFLYKTDTYFNGSSEVALSGYDLYKIPLSVGDVIYINNSDNEEFWGALTDSYAAWSHYTGTYYPISGLAGNNKLGGMSIAGHVGVLFVGVSGSDFCLFSIQRTKLAKTSVYKNVPYFGFKKSGDVNLQRTVTNVPNAPTISISTGRMYAKPPYGYIDGLDSSVGNARCLHVKQGDKLVFNSLPTGFSFYGTFCYDSYAVNITSPTYTVSHDGYCFLFYSTSDSADRIMFYPVDSIKIDYEHVVNKPSAESKPLYGKTIAFFGDSITYNYVWEPYVLNDVGGTGVNCGIGSTCLSGTDSNAFWQATRLDAVKAANPDVVTILGGANDLVQNPIIGTTANLADKDTGTFIGAYSYIINNLLTWKPSLKIIILSTTWAHNDGADYSQTVTYGDYAAACKQVAEYYHLPYVDLYNESGFNAYTLNDSPYNIYSSDHIHPNTAGGKIIASMVIEKIREVFGVQ